MRYAEQVNGLLNVPITLLAAEEKREELGLGMPCGSYSVGDCSSDFCFRRGEVCAENAARLSFCWREGEQGFITYTVRRQLCLVLPTLHPFFFSWPREERHVFGSVSLSFLLFFPREHPPGPVSKRRAFTAVAGSLFYACFGFLGRVPFASLALLALLIYKLLPSSVDVFGAFVLPRLSAFGL